MSDTGEEGKVIIIVPPLIALIFRNASDFAQTTWIDFDPCRWARSDTFQKIKPPENGNVRTLAFR